MVLHSVQRTSYTVTNPAPIAGDQDRETDEAMYARFQSFRTASRKAVLSAAMNAILDGERLCDAALILPWRIPSLNCELGHAYVAIDSGSASTLQLARAQVGLDQVSSVISVGILSHTSDIMVLVGARAVAGVASVRVVYT